MVNVVTAMEDHRMTIGMMQQAGTGLREGVQTGAGMLNFFEVQRVQTQTFLTMVKQMGDTNLYMMRASLQAAELFQNNLTQLTEAMAQAAKEATQELERTTKRVVADTSREIDRARQHGQSQSERSARA